MALHVTATKGQQSGLQPEQKPFEHWIFNAVKAGNPNLRSFMNECSNCMIDRIIVNTRNSMLYVLTKSGIVYDSTKLVTNTGTDKRFDAFAYTRRQLNTSLDKLNELREQVRKNVNNSGGRLFGNRSKQLPAWLAALNKCATPLEQLEMLDHIGQPLYETVYYLDYDLKNLEVKKSDSSKKHFIEEDLKVGLRKLTVYENPNRLSAYTHAILDTGRKKIYFSRQFAGIVDSLSVRDNSIAELEKGNINVFYLYRGWLESKLYELDKWKTKAEPVFRTQLSQFIKKGADSSFIAAWKGFSDEQIEKVTAIRTKINQSIATLAWPNPHKLFAGTNYFTGDEAIVYTQTRGLKRYELTDHRGNVLATLSDRKLPANSGSVGSMVTYYKADILSANDHYPFGMMMPGRNYNKAGVPDYRYGYNGKENDNDVKDGEGMQQDYGMRIYDPRLGRFLSVDPITKSYPELTPYQFASNSPIWAIDIDGMEANMPTDPAKYNARVMDAIRTALNTVNEYNARRQYTFDGTQHKILTDKIDYYASKNNLTSGERNVFAEMTKNYFIGIGIMNEWDAKRVRNYTVLLDPVWDNSKDYSISTKIKWINAAIIEYNNLDNIFTSVVFQVLPLIIGSPHGTNGGQSKPKGPRLSSTQQEQIAKYGKIIHEQATVKAKPDKQDVTSKANNKAPEYAGGETTENGFLNSGLKWLQKGYTYQGNGRYVSKDGLRQIRYGKHETNSNQHHGHFETYNKPASEGGKVIETTTVKIVPDKSN